VDDGTRHTAERAAGGVGATVRGQRDHRCREFVGDPENAGRRVTIGDDA
jgi:hypothetical protein